MVSLRQSYQPYWKRLDPPGERVSFLVLVTRVPEKQAEQVPSVLPTLFKIDRADLKKGSFARPAESDVLNVGRRTSWAVSEMIGCHGLNVRKMSTKNIVYLSCLIIEITVFHHHFTPSAPACINYYHSIRKLLTWKMNTSLIIGSSCSLQFPKYI